MYCASASTSTIDSARLHVTYAGSLTTPPGFIDLCSASLRLSWANSIDYLSGCLYRASRRSSKQRRKQTSKPCCGEPLDVYNSSTPTSTPPTPQTTIRYACLLSLDVPTTHISHSLIARSLTHPLSLIRIPHLHTILASHHTHNAYAHAHLEPGLFIYRAWILDP